MFSPVTSDKHVAIKNVGGHKTVQLLGPKKNAMHVATGPCCPPTTHTVNANTPTHATHTPKKHDAAPADAPELIEGVVSLVLRLSVCAPS